MNGVSRFPSRAIQDRYELDVYGKRGPTLVRGRGALLWDDEGRSYIDCIAGHGSANLGHGHPRILATLRHQAERLTVCPGSFHNDAKALYLKRLMARAPAGLSRAFLCNSGAEAVEAALKFARLLTGRSRFVAARRAFHGRSFGALSVSFNPRFRRPFEPLLGHVSHVSFNQPQALAAALDGEVAALVLELVQGEGGVIPARADFVAEARRLCDLHGILLIIDEVQTGFGRTGRYFACEHYGLKPDILCLAKAMAAGLPMGATLVREGLTIPVGLHGSTFGGNPLVCAVATAVLDVLDAEGLPERALLMGNQWVEQLAAASLPVVRQIRHRGLMIGIELKIRVKPVLASLLKRGVLALAAGSTTLRLLPPLVISREQWDRVGQIVQAVLESA